MIIDNLTLVGLAQVLVITVFLLFSELHRKKTGPITTDLSHLQ